MIRFKLDAALARTLASVTGAFFCAAIALGAALPLTPIA